MNKLLTLTIVAAGEGPVSITLNPEYIETIIDGKPFGHGDVTQVTMISGNKFFVKESYSNLKENLTLYFNK